MDTLFASLVAVAGTLAGSLGTLRYQMRATLRAEHRRALHRTGADFLTALTAYRAAVYTLWVANTRTAETGTKTEVAAVRSARASLTAARDTLLLLTTDSTVRAAVRTAVSATFALGDDTEQDHVTTGRPAALDAHNHLLDALAHAINSA